ncbi:MAG: UDP-N-acetylmuramate:L-alanyl-gamma-D-glutamyl-meso-diaminopimelate ligase [Pseudomonadota bacterium]
MHIHILGICGTFMGGVAALARAAGHRVTGCDTNVYPPMSDQLRKLGIDVIAGWDVNQLSLQPDQFVVGNVVSRGNPLMEAILDSQLDYVSGPGWLAANVLRGRKVIAVAGTHGKTTTASLLTHLLTEAGLAPGFLIGGIPENFGVSAQLGEGVPFVVEADEYDTAFFDKRAKFVHYRPSVAVLNNLEFDHADIYEDLAAIEWQFHQLLRTVPGNGTLVVNADDQNLQRVLQAGCWTPVSGFSTGAVAGADLHVQLDAAAGDVLLTGATGTIRTATPLAGAHNLANTAAALLACQAVGVPLAEAAAGLASFKSVKRRLEQFIATGQLTAYDDFAHHPTAIALTVAALRQRHPDGRLIVAFEPRSNSMRLGIHQQTLAAAFDGADTVFVLRPANLDWDLAAALSHSSAAVRVYDSLDALYADLVHTLGAGDHLALMSNGSFGGLRQRLVARYLEGASGE